jgi:tripartite ATP-independent transporter DctM subunit
MEILFLLILIITMVAALGSGFPVAFALPGSAIFTISLAALCGVLFGGGADAYFAHGDPIQWLNAGVTNFRGIYWEAERDTLIAIPLFIFMGIMLERSKIAEDLLVTMAQLFGPIPGGLGISVVVVGALLAATTGIVGATVIAMGLISLPVMLRANYSHSLATGTISASGTLGQIIPPSIVLIILADQLSNATDRAASIRTAEYKLGTGSSALPSEFAITSTSAGDMFLGAFIPGMILVGLYILYILVVAFVRPKMAPATPYTGKFDRSFLARVLVVLVPPLALIFAVLGSIIMGIATVNQAGAIGAIGAMIMAGYRLMEGEKGAFSPALLGGLALAALMVILSTYDINVKNIVDQEDVNGVIFASIASIALLGAIAWSGWRVFKINKTLEGVMIETAKTTSLVFIILLGAAMLTAAFRAFGGEELVRDFLTGLPGGFLTKFIVVMAVIFVLGFFLDFIEIAVVVVPIIAPILLADPTANVTAVWLGVMIGVNMQTSFLTPPFGFALFYLRGVAPPEVKTLEMYRGVIPFILLQLLGLFIVGYHPPLVNYLPNRVYLTSETAPPPRNPKLQRCVERFLFDKYDLNAEELKSSIASAASLDISLLPKKHQSGLKEGFAAANKTFDMVENVRKTEEKRLSYIPEYRPLHEEMRDIRVEIGTFDRELNELEKIRRRLSRDGEAGKAELEHVMSEMAELEANKKQALANTPVGWDKARERYVALEKAEEKARRTYRNTVDDAYESLSKIQNLIGSADKLAVLADELYGLDSVIANAAAPEAIAKIKAISSKIGSVNGASSIKSKLSKARRAIKRKDDRVKAAKELAKALKIFDDEVKWRQAAKGELLAGLQTYNSSIYDTIGLRLQPRLTKAQAKEIASCLSDHRDISLSF